MSSVLGSKGARVGREHQQGRRAASGRARAPDDFRATAAGEGFGEAGKDRKQFHTVTHFTRRALPYTQSNPASFLPCATMYPPHVAGAPPGTHLGNGLPPALHTRTALPRAAFRLRLRVHEVRTGEHGRVYTEGWVLGRYGIPPIDWKRTGFWV